MNSICIFITFSANGDEILGGANNGYIYIYDRFAQTRSLRIDAHDDDVNAVAFVDEATHILASGGNKYFFSINLKGKFYILSFDKFFGGAFVDEATHILASGVNK